MSTIGNILWIIFGGLIYSLCWCLAGLLCCITIVGIPIGVQCFKIAGFVLCPFGHDIIYGGGGLSFIANILWIIFCGWELAVSAIAAGIVLCVSIVGIPFGLQYFKFAKLALMPFGATFS